MASMDQTTSNVNFYGISTKDLLDCSKKSLPQINEFRDAKIAAEKKEMNWNLVKAFAFGCFVGYGAGSFFDIEKFGAGFVTGVIFVVIIYQKNQAYLEQVIKGLNQVCLVKELCNLKNGKMVFQLTDLPAKKKYNSEIERFMYEDLDKKLGSTTTIITIAPDFLKQTLSGHKNDIPSLCELRTSNILASCSDDNTIMLWDPKKDYSCTKTLKGHSEGIVSVKQLQSGLLVSSSKDRTIKLWSPKDYACIKTLHGHLAGVGSLSELNNCHLVSSSFDGTIKIWDPSQDYLCIQTIPTQGRNLLGREKTIILCALKDGSFVCGEVDGTIKFWSTSKSVFDWSKEYKCSQTIKAHNFGITAICELENGHLISCSDKTVKVWDPNKGYACIATLTDHESKVTSLCPLKNTHLATGSFGGIIRVWDPKKNYQCISTMQENQGTLSSLLELSGGYLASGGQNKLTMRKDDNDYVIKLWQNIQ